MFVLARPTCPSCAGAQPQELGHWFLQSKPTTVFWNSILEWLPEDSRGLNLDSNLNSLGDVYVHKTPTSPPQNIPFPGLSLKVGKTNYCLGNLVPNWANCLKSGQNFSRIGPRKKFMIFLALHCLYAENPRGFLVTVLHMCAETLIAVNGLSEALKHTLWWMIHPNFQSFTNLHTRLPLDERHTPWAGPVLQVEREV